MLAETIQLDKQIRQTLKENLDRTYSSYLQIKKNRELVKRYSPYSKQTMGIFIDRKK